MGLFIGLSIYFGIGFLISVLGIYTHSKAWGMSFRDSFDLNFKLYVLMGLVWPLAVDLLLNHSGPSR